METGLILRSCREGSLLLILTALYGGIVPLRVKSCMALAIMRLGNSGIQYTEVMQDDK